MAKSKNSRALFEVIKQSQAIQAKRQLPRPPRQANPLLSWFKRRVEPREDQNEAMLPVMREIAPPESHADQQVNVLRVSRKSDRSQIIDEPSQPAETIDSDADVQRVFHDDSMEADSAASDESHAEHDNHEHGDDAHHSAAEQEDPFGVAHDTEESSQPSSHDTAVAMSAIANDETSEDRAEAKSEEQPLPVAAPRRAARENRIHFVLSYPSIAVASIAMMLLMIVAFLAGRHTARPIALTGPSLEQIQNNKPSPDVLNLSTTPTRTQLSQPKDPEKPAAKTAPKETPADAGAAAMPTPDRRRVVGRNYIIAQSYPDPDNAAKAADVLVKNNIPVSVEQIDAAPGWYCVVTEVGFDRVSTDECDRYQKLIRDCNAAAKQARLKVFEPYLVKWK